MNFAYRRANPANLHEGRKTMFRLAIELLALLYVGSVAYSAGRSTGRVEGRSSAAREVLSQLDADEGGAVMTRQTGKSPLLVAPYTSTLQLGYATVFASLTPEPYNGPELIRADVCRAIRWNAWGHHTDAVFSKRVLLPAHFSTP